MSTYSYCEDCGCRMYDGICPNCMEELYIYETQSEDLLEPLGGDFASKVREQSRDLSRKG